MPIDRRRFSALCAFSARALAAAALGAGAGRDAAAQFRVEIGGVGATQLPVAVARLRGDDPAAAAVAAIVRADLERSGLFRLVDAGAAALDENAAPAYAEWKGRGADALVAGSLVRLADGRFDVRFKLWDAVAAREVLGQSLLALPAESRLVAHRIADAVQEKLTGVPGVNASRLALVSRRPGGATLRIADADGEAAQVALTSPQPLISPAWSPDGRRLAYVSFESGKASVMVQDVASGTRRVVAAFRGSNSAPAWAPDGRTLAVALSRDGNTQLYAVDAAAAAGAEPRRLTTSDGIDTEPAWTADGRWLYFVSDRGGSPQVYRMPAGGGPAERVTFAGAHNVSPAVSPDGRLLAYVGREAGGWRAMVMPLDGAGAPLAVGEGRGDDSPSFAPNGRLIAYAAREGGRSALMVATVDGRLRSRLAPSLDDVREPAWGPMQR